MSASVSEHTLASSTEDERLGKMIGQSEQDHTSGTNGVVDEKYTDTTSPTDDRTPTIDDKETPRIASLNENAPTDKDDEERFLVRWDTHEEVGCPMGMPTSKKWFITLVVAMGSFNVTCASSIYSATYKQIEAEFNVSHELAIAGLSLFVLGLGIGPMALGPLSEFYGRRPIYIVSFAFYVAFLIPCATAQNIETLLIGRFLDGIAGSAFLSVAGGTVRDMFQGKDLGLPMMVFTAAPFLGPEVGPIIGGFINQYTHWRWTWYVMIIWSVAIWMALCLVPETYNPVLLQRRAAKMRNETGNERWYAPLDKREHGVTITILHHCQRPFQLLIFEPMVLALCTFTALLLGILYLFFQAFGIVFTGSHGFTLSQVGLTFLGLLIGMLLGMCTDPIWKKIYQQMVAKRNGENIPEFRLLAAIPGGILIPISLLWFGWTSYASIHWIVPVIGSSLFGMGMLLVFSSVFGWLVEYVPAYAASALAANSFMRSCFAAAFPLFTPALFAALGNQWAIFLLACLSLVMMPLPYLFFKYGEQLRKRSRYGKK